MTMKKIMMSLTALFAWCGGAAAQQVAVAPIEALPGETVVLSMQLDTDGGSYTGLELDIQFPGEGFTTTGTATTTAAWDGAFTIGDVGGVGIDNLARCGVLSYSDTAIPGSGLQDFGTVEFTVGSGVATGSYTVTLTNMTLIGEGRVAVPDATFTLNVVSVHTVVLDENSTTAPAASDGVVNVQVKRTIKAGNWSTIVLPFAMSGEQVEEAFGSDAKLADFTGVQTTTDEADNIVSMKVSFSQATAIEANHPYLIKVGKDISEFTVDGVTVSPEEEPSVERDEQSVKVGKITYTSYNRFIGTYVAETPVDELMLFLNGNKFYYSDGTVKMKAYRAYFDFYDVLSDIENAGVKMFLDIDGEQTHIGEIVNDKSSNGKWFDLCGRNVRQAEKGLYIVNGKKVMVK